MAEHEDWYERMERAVEHEEHGRAKPPLNAAVAPLPLTFFDECSTTAPKRWLIKGVIAFGETSSWIAPPGKGKSALHSDISVHLAAGLDWRGHRTKGKFGVVYFAFERADLVKRRNAAYAKRLDLKGLPIAIASQIINLMHPKCVDVILATIRAAETRFGIPVSYIVIDTFAKGIAAGGGDEDKARDQNRCLTNLRRVHEQIDLHIAIVGHTGKDETKGSRGSNAHPADADVQVQIFGEEIKSARVIKGNDQPEGELIAFKLESADLGIDEDGDSITTAILCDQMFEEQARAPKRKLSDRQKLALGALTEVVLACGAHPPPAWQLPNGVQVVGLEDWRKELARAGVLDSEAPNPRQDFKRIRESLAARKLIGQRDGSVWAA
jgi:AAA domain